MLVRCDFCSSPAFKPQAWNQRTCHRCAVLGAPDQSKDSNYPERLKTWLEQRRKALRVSQKAKQPPKRH